jgi:hypothetical protein
MLVPSEEDVIRSGLENPQCSHSSAQSICPVRDRRIVWVFFAGRKVSLPSSCPEEVTSDPVFNLLLFLPLNEPLNDTKPWRPSAYHQTPLFIARIWHRSIGRIGVPPHRQRRGGFLWCQGSKPLPLGVDAMDTNDPPRQGCGSGTSRNSGASPKERTFPLLSSIQTP